MKYIYHVFFALFAASASFAATVDLSTLTGDYEALDGDVLTGTLEGKDQPYKISIADGAKVTLSDATINGVNDLELDWAGLTCLGNCTIELSGSNIVKGFYKDYPGIQAAKNEGDGEEYTLTIEGEGSLDASSNGYGAGIGGGFDINCGNITISGGTVTVTGGYSAAGIGSAEKGTSGDITISGGTVTVTGGYSAAGIGSTEKGTSGDITISGGTVTATGGYSAAGIGSGYGGTSGAITISGGTVTATGGDEAAGIGGSGYGGTSGAITISGGTVTATGGDYGAGIGSGNYGGNNVDISISDGTVTATGGIGAAGIGSGYGGFTGDISISGGKVLATGGDDGVGIGGGSLGTSGDISISDGTVTAIGGDYAAGIGSGSEGTSRDITITNENGVTKVVATKGEFADYSVGAGYGGEAGKVTIGDVEGAIAKKIFVFPATPVDVVAVGGKKYAVVDGDYNGDAALSITKDKSVDKVIFDRTFPAIDGENNYSTIMFPFEINAAAVSNVKQVVSFLGIGLDNKKHKYVAVERVWCNDDSKDECNYSTGKFEAYKPYLIQLESGETSVAINNTAPLVIKAAPTDLSAYDVVQNGEYNKVGDYVFRGVIQTKNWNADDPDVLGTGNAAAYGFAGASASGVKVGQFVKVAGGAYIKPFRAYIHKKPVPQSVKSNGAYVLRQTASIDDDVPDVMNIVIVDRKKDGEKQTTVIGQFNSRTGEIRLNRTKRTYDLKGRYVRDASRMAKGVYLKK